MFVIERAEKTCGNKIKFDLVTKIHSVTRL